jgi:hypothetical protein
LREGYKYFQPLSQSLPPSSATLFTPATSQPSLYQPKDPLSQGILISTPILRRLFRNLLWALARLALVKVTSLRHPARFFLDVAALLRRDIAVVSCARDVTAVLGSAAGELVGHGLVDARLPCWIVLVDAGLGWVRWCKGKEKYLSHCPLGHPCHRNLCRLGCRISHGRSSGPFQLVWRCPLGLALRIL